MFVTANIYWVLLCARHYAKCFTCIVSFNPHNKSCVFPTKKKKEKKKEEKKSKKERKGGRGQKKEGGGEREEPFIVPRP